MKTLAIIPIRSGSKRTPDKNIRLVRGEPLVAYSIQTALSAKGIDDVLVCSDSEKYLEIAASYGAKTLLRPKEIAGDYSTLEETVEYILKSMGAEYDTVILIQATSPLTKKESMELGVSLLEKSERLNSVSSSEKFNRFFIDDPDILERPRTQDRDSRLLETGCFWVFRTKKFLEVKNRLIEPVGYVEVSRIEALDIDSEEDLKIIESLFPIDKPYYVSREKSNPDSEYNFGTRLDPDGVSRDHKAEKEEKLDFVKDELKFINSLPGGNFLDLGCGLGFVCSGVDRSKFKKFGIDPSRDAVEFAVKNVNDTSFFGGTLDNIEFMKNFFDVIFSHHVIEHVREPELFITNVGKILKRHGHLIISTPNFGSPLAERFGENFRMLHDDDHISLFSAESFVRFLDDYGFHVDRLDFPFFNTRYFTMENLARLFDTSKVSPAFYGNIMTAYCRKK